MLAHLGRAALDLASDTGGMTVLLGRVVAAVGRRRCDREELWRALHDFGLASLPIVLATAAFTGMIMVLQSAVYVRQFGVYNLVGWFSGFSTLREIAPVLIGLMFSGRVGANNTSELATLSATEGLDALRVLSLDPLELLVAPRAVAMVLSMVALVIFGDAVALVAGAVCAERLMGVSFSEFTASLLTYLGPADFLLGVGKASLFGGAIAVVSSYYGLGNRHGTAGVGEAVKVQVVGSAVSVVLLDYLLTSVNP
jgi:phospholipid/cholesterol/gamma-HCH transport system permease protein